MERVVRLAVVDPNEASRGVLKNLLLGIDVVWLEAECSRYEFFLDVVRQTQPDIALISLDADATKALELVATISRELPECAVLVVSSSQEGSLILQAMRSGAREFLGYPLRLDDFLAALDRIQHSLVVARGAGEPRTKRVIAVVGVAGGVGATSLAVNLACMYAQDERNSVVLMDLDLVLGDADVWLDIIPDYTIQDVADNISRLDFSLLKRSLTQHSSGAFLLPRPVQIEQQTPITPDELRRVIALLKATSTHVILDLSKSFTGLDLAALESADTILVVTQLDLPCLRNVVRLLQFFDQQEGLSEKVKVVVNRVGLEETEISLNKALETIGREIFWQIPNDYATMVESRNNGVPLLTQAPRSKVARSIQQLAASLDDSGATPDADQEAKKSKKGLFSFLARTNR